MRAPQDIGVQTLEFRNYKVGIAHLSEVRPLVNKVDWGGRLLPYLPQWKIWQGNRLKSSQTYVGGQTGSKGGSYLAMVRARIRLTAAHLRSKTQPS